MARRRYLFSNRKNPERGVFSAAIGVISLLAVCGALLVSYRQQGAVSVRLGAVMLLSVVFSVTGLILGIASNAEPDVLSFFPRAGIVINAVTVVLCGVVIYAGM